MRMHISCVDYYPIIRIQGMAAKFPPAVLSGSLPKLEQFPTGVLVIEVHIGFVRRTRSYYRTRLRPPRQGIYGRVSCDENAHLGGALKNYLGYSKGLPCWSAVAIGAQGKQTTQHGFTKVFHKGLIHTMHTTPTHYLEHQVRIAAASCCCFSVSVDHVINLSPRQLRTALLLGAANQDTRTKREEPRLVSCHPFAFASIDRHVQPYLLHATIRSPSRGAGIRNGQE